MGDKPPEQQTLNVALEIRRLQYHAAMTRGEQAYREFPHYVARKCADILKAMEARE